MNLSIKTYLFVLKYTQICPYSLKYSGSETIYHIFSKPLRKYVTHHPKTTLPHVIISFYDLKFEFMSN
jgi:hypothetical protein